MRMWAVLLLVTLTAPQPALAQTPTAEAPATKAKLDPNSITRFIGTREGQRAMMELGEVSASVCVSANGVASDVTITKSSGNARLDQATQKMLSGARYHPAKDSNGSPVAMCDPPYTIDWKWTPPPR